MHYVCMENNIVVGILNYKPEVPSSVTVFEITDEDYQKIVSQSHYFDTNEKKLIECPVEFALQRDLEKQNITYREFLRSTDWKVLRHIREKALGLEQSLTDEEYITLEKKRAEAAKSIINILRN